MQTQNPQDSAKPLSAIVPSMPSATMMPNPTVFPPKPSVNLPVIKPVNTGMLEQAGIYSNAGNLQIDRYTTLLGVNTSSATISSGTVTGILTVPKGVNSTDAAQFSQISGFRILQVIQAQTATNVSSNSGTYTDTTLTATITPTSTLSKIFILVTQQVETDGAGGVTVCSIQLLRGASIVSGPWAAGYQYGIANLDSHGYFPFTYIDSPNTTSATTYKTQFARSAGANNVQVQGQPNGVASLSTIILVEIN